MQTDVTNDIFEIIKILPKDKQKKILQQAKAMAKEEEKPTIWDKIREHAARIPDDEWDKMPVDGSEQLDHYLYGSPKK